MAETKIDGLRIILGDPIQVTEGVGHCWFASLTSFTTGELLIIHSAIADAESAIKGAPLFGVSVSSDGGQSWPTHYKTSQVCAIKIPRPDGSIVCTPYIVEPDPPGQRRNFCGDYTRFEARGRRFVVEPGAVHVTGFPRDVAYMAFNGDALELEGRLLATMYGAFVGDKLGSAVVAESYDEGFNWRYVSTIAGPEAVPDAPEGPDEASMIRLADGDLMCVMRVGSGAPWNLARAYCGDGGRTWSAVDRLPAFSVEPSLRRLSNGTLVLSSGRPGIYLWVSTDPRGKSWRQIDLVQHHNMWAPGPEYTITPERSADREQRHAADQTTAYTQLVEVEPNHLLMVYDRVPFGWNPVPADSTERSRIFVMPIQVERT
ncbi:MAG: exo-alpha-sialidase [Chloroflexi bacterium]|nr:exo-alpha-sialidase [Chloroflexota bacterium]